MTRSKAAPIALALALASLQAACTAPTISRPTAYGSNPTAGGYFMHDGVKLYYEVYGKGPPLLVIHGNGLSIWWMKNQIAHFSKHYQVIAMDSRDHGRSADAPGPLTYEQMADDLAALLDHLHARPALVLGWSDGGIEALLLGLRHPERVEKIASMAANLEPGGIVPELTGPSDASPSAQPPHKPSGPPTRDQLVAALMRDQPHIKPDDLKAIAAPTLVMASDHDVIRDEHTLEIYHHIPNSQLIVFPNATHTISLDDPERFNAAVDRFFREPFVKKDRVKDVEKTIQRAQWAQKADLLLAPK